MAEALGFKKEGTRRAALYKNNDYVDLIEYGLLKNEWAGETYDAGNW
jgi:RimJ/RimL family protein N-acetyltransferase